jgi:hypothetical protein
MCSRSWLTEVVGPFLCLEAIMQSSSAVQNGRVRRSASEWRVLVQRFAESGQSRSLFCESEGISRSTFDLWHRKLQTNGSARRSAGDFVELVSTPGAVGGWSIEIELPDGTLARLRS